MDYLPVTSTQCSLLLNAHFTADQLTGLFVARASSPATSVTPQRSISSCSRSKWAHFTARTSPATLRTPRCADIISSLGTPQCSVIASNAKDSSLLGPRTSPATLGTPRSSVLGHRQRRRGLLAPRCSVIASDAGDSSLLSARSSPATLGTSRSSVLGHR